jgi:hypothetical protein
MDESADEPSSSQPSSGHPEMGGDFLIPPRVQHCIMYWLLTLVAMAIFAPCVLMPIWVRSDQILESEQDARRLISELEMQVDRNAERIRALTADPAVNERLMKHELRYREEGEQLIAWPKSELAAIPVDLSELQPEDDFEPAPNPYPQWALAVRQWLPKWQWRELFTKSPSRPLLLMMSAGLLITAVLLYGPRPGKAD